MVWSINKYKGILDTLITMLFFLVCLQSLWKTLGASLMFKKLSSSGTTDAIYGNEYNFLQTQARGIMVMFNAANAARLTVALRKASAKSVTCPG